MKKIECIEKCLSDTAVDNTLLVLVVYPEDFKPKFDSSPFKNKGKFYLPNYKGSISNIFRADIVIAQEKTQYRILKNATAPLNTKPRRGQFNLLKITTKPCLIVYTQHFPPKAAYVYPE